MSTLKIWDIKKGNGPGKGISPDEEASNVVVGLTAVRTGLMAVPTVSVTPKENAIALKNAVND